MASDDSHWFTPLVKGAGPPSFKPCGHRALVIPARFRPESTEARCASMRVDPGQVRAGMTGGDILGSSVVERVAAVVAQCG